MVGSRAGDDGAQRVAVIRVFAGYDVREAIGFHVFMSSAIHKTSEELSVTPVFGDPKGGTNAFSHARFLVPAMCGFEGWALWCDGADMLVRADLAELWAFRNPEMAVQVVQHDYRTTTARKYLGTAMEASNAAYPRKNWSSLILWNCAHPSNACLTRNVVSKQASSYLHRFEWLQDREIGALPPEWNVLVGEHAYPAKIAHYTYGIPWFPQYADSPYADEWRREVQRLHQSGVM